MKPTLIYDLVELAISLAHNHLQDDDLELTLADIITKAVQAYHEYTGKPVDPNMVGIEGTL